MELRGPTPAPIEKIQDQYRWQLWYFVGSVSRLVPRLQQLRKDFPWPEDLINTLDVDPANLG